MRTHHAAQRMTIKQAIAVASEAMSKTKNKTSRCSVVILDGSIEDSFAIRPLYDMSRQHQCNIDEVHAHKTVLSPLCTTSPTPEPLTQCVPCSAMFLVFVGCVSNL